MARKKLLANVTYLGLVQITNYLVPLIAIPILLARIGLAKYGVISLAANLCTMLVALTDYGYNLIGTREVSKNRKSPLALARIASEILHVRVVLVFLGFFLLLSLVWLIPTWRAESFVILTSYLLVVAQALFPVWYYQGIEKMEFLTLINFLARLLYLVGILVFIQETSDYIYVNIINGVAWSLTTGTGLFLVLRKLRLSSFKLSPQLPIKGLRSNFPIFLSLSTTAAHRYSALIIGGFFFQGDTLGLFAVIDKIIGLLTMSGAVAFRALFARVSQIAAEGYQQVLNFSKKLLRITLAPAILGSIVFGAVGPWLLALVTEIDAASMKKYFLLIAVMPPLLLINLPINLMLVSLDMKRKFFYYSVTGMLVTVLLGIVGAQVLGISGLIVATLLGEVSMIIFGYRQLSDRLQAT